MFILELVGVASFAVSGAMVGIDKKADAFGVIFLAIVTALGGGVLRDMMLGHLPPRMFTSFVYIALAAGCAAVVFIDALARRDKYRMRKERIDAIDNIFDAAGLAAFTVSGMDIAIAECGMGNAVLIVALGMTTGIGGGMLRDVLTNAMPMVLRKRVYAVASLLGALLYYLLLYLRVDNMVSAVAAMVLIFALRMLATVFKWNLPRAEL